MDSFRYICLTYYAPYVLIAGTAGAVTRPSAQALSQFAKAKVREPRLRPSRSREPAASRHARRAQGRSAPIGLGVPFTGAGPMAQALLSGTVMAITETPGGRAPRATCRSSPRLSDTRIAALPDVPHDGGLGYPATSSRPAA